jgi:hypothetical protein
LGIGNETIYVKVIRKLSAFDKYARISENSWEAGLMGEPWSSCKQHRILARTQKADFYPQPLEAAAHILQFGTHRLAKQDF